MMRKANKLYIDSEGVERGYYVYLHRDCTTDEVFYVGKGHGSRAWNATSRNQVWQEKVASLTTGWYVDIAKDDLSESEAFELEEELVDKYGGALSSGGKLTNWIPGGEDPAAIKLAVELNDEGWQEAYCNVRQFKKLPRSEQELLARELDAELGQISQQLDTLLDEADAHGDQVLEDSVYNLDGWLSGFLDVSSDFLRCRVSWEDYGLALEETADSLEWDLEDIDEYHRKVKPLLIEAAKIAADFLTRIDSGNRQEAEDAADRDRRKES